jgi:hypothetical protein
MTLAMFSRRRGASSGLQGRRGLAPSLTIAGVIVAGFIFGGVAFYLAVREPSQDLGIPRRVTVQALGIRALPTAMPLPSQRRQPRSERPPNSTESGTHTPPAPTPPKSGGNVEQHRAAPAAPSESAAESPVLVPEGVERP